MMAKKKEEKFEKVVEWSWMKDTGIELLLILVAFAYGWMMGYNNNIYGLIGFSFVLSLFILLLSGFPKRKVYWRKLK
jgi:hypothetical protein